MMVLVQQKVYKDWSVSIPLHIPYTKVADTLQKTKHHSQNVLNSQIWIQTSGESDWFVHREQCELSAADFNKKDKRARGITKWMSR